MIFAAVLLSVMSVAYDPCELGGIGVDSIRSAALHGDSLAIRKMACIAFSGQLYLAEDLFWRYRYLQINPCAIGYFERRLKPWRVAAQFLSVGLTDSSVASCRENIERAIVRVCQNDSLRVYSPCNPYRNKKPRSPIVAHQPPQGMMDDGESDSVR